MQEGGPWSITNRWSERKDSMNNSNAKVATKECKCGKWGIHTKKIYPLRCKAAAAAAAVRVRQARIEGGTTTKSKRKKRRPSLLERDILAVHDSHV